MPGWRGVPESDVYTPETLAYVRAKGSHFVPPEGESFRMVQRRVAGWLEDEIIYNRDLVAKGQSLTVAIVGHSAASRCLFQYIMGFDEAVIRRIVIDNCSISRFLFNRNGWSMVCINDALHLAESNLNGDSQASP
jgi:broad specificity phosphatase PhoE